SGPAARFVGRPAEFVTTVRNGSERELRNVTIEESVPVEIELAGLPEGGIWDPRQRVIRWTIPQLAPGEQREIKSALVARSAGEHLGRVDARDAAGNRAELATEFNVKGFADLEIDVVAPHRHFVVGEQVSLRMTV